MIENITSISETKLTNFHDLNLNSKPSKNDNFTMLYKFLDTPYIEYLVEKNAPKNRKEILQQAEECIRYLFLSHLRDGDIPVSKEVDEIWHLLILETRAYKELCQKLPGKQFIHHKSNVYEKLTRSPDREDPS